MNEFLILILIFQVKHFLSDYVLQNDYMLGKFKKKYWVAPLICHSAIHGGFTLLIASMYVSWDYAVLLAFADLVVHFIIDKAKVECSRKYSAKDKEFWWLLGLDQMLHHMTHYAIAFLLVAISGGFN